MEYFGSLPGTPKDECLRIVRSCNFYVGIYAMRYGSIDEKSGKSLTQLEYEEAQRISLPSLIYLVNEELQPVLPKHVEFGEGAEKLRIFKESLRKNHMVCLFTTSDDLAAKVTRDIPELVARNGFEIRVGELSKIVSHISRIDWLTDERFSFLKKEVSEIASPIPSDAILRETLEFLLSGDRQAAVFLLTRATKLDFRASFDLLMEIESKLKEVVERGNKIIESTKS